MICLQLNKQQGLTLIEILGTIVILSVIIISIWTIFFQGNNYSNKAISKSIMQQEANQIIYELTNIHQKSESYTMKVNSCEFTVEYKTLSETKLESFSDSRMCISLQNVPSDPIDPKNQNEINLNLVISDMKNPTSSSTIQVELFLHRLKGVTN